MKVFRHFILMICMPLLFLFLLPLVYSTLRDPVDHSTQMKKYIPDQTITYQSTESKISAQPSVDFDDRIKRSWSEGIDRLEVPVSNYLRFNYFETDQITQKMGDEEATSFNDTLLNSLISVRKTGDLVPIVLIDQSFNNAILVFQKNEGKGGFVGIFMSNEGTQKWKVNSIDKL
ncbi:hypothetical protein [Brevibacillus brevis]|uniref:hypothetical protein n=1 Tax=Brevibacillus brevis TaxID=1393 RepID=UPI0025A50787|nr:hypothetical protein [Brevibacillus brevis]WJQ81225.1 hypothetical protein QN310_27950 [Brevibacillus brevis]